MAYTDGDILLTGVCEGDDKEEISAVFSSDAFIFSLSLEIISLCHNFLHRWVCAAKNLKIQCLRIHSLLTWTQSMNVSSIIATNV